MPPFDLAQHLQGVERLAHVLGGGDLHHPDQAQAGVDVDHGPVGGADQGHVGVALAVGVERMGQPVVVLDLLLEHHPGRRLGHGHVDRAARAGGDAAVDDRQCFGVDAVAAADLGQQRGAHGQARLLDRAPGHPGLAAGRGRAGRADGRVGRGQQDVVDAEDTAGDLLGQRHEPLADLGRRAGDGGQAVGEPAPGRRAVHVALGVHQILEPDREADAPANVLGIGGAAGAPGPRHRLDARPRRRRASAGRRLRG